MRSTSETGHAKNVANFNELISFAIGYGEDYNPSKAAIRVISLQAVAGNAKSAIDLVNNSIPAYSNGVAAREVAFAPLSKFVTRLMNALIATDASRQVEENARTLVRKIHGTRAKAKKSDEANQAAAAKGKSAKEISSSQMSFDSRLDNFDKLIKLLASISDYVPNEEELKITALTALYDSLNEKNAEVRAAIAPLSNARISRNKIFYTKNSGLVDIAKDTKAYIKSVYGASSPQYKQVSKLAFKTVKI
jgi:hypothetical protein